MTKTAYKNIPFIVSAAFMLLVLLISLLWTFGKIFIPGNEGPAILVLLGTPIVWFFLMVYNTFAYSMIKPAGIRPWMIVLPAALPIVELLRFLLWRLFALIQNNAMISAVTEVSISRWLYVLQLLLCIPFFIALVREIRSKS